MVLEEYVEIQPRRKLIKQPTEGLRCREARIVMILFGTYEGIF